MKGMKKGGRDNGGDCTKESRCNPAARVVARETEGGGGARRQERESRGNRIPLRGGWNERHLDTFSFSLGRE